jgi:hypothetical protein
LQRLVARGFAATPIARVTRAIGIGARAPGTVALALAARLVQASADKGAPTLRRVGIET